MACPYPIETVARRMNGFDKFSVLPVAPARREKHTLFDACSTDRVQYIMLDFSVIRPA